MLESINIPFYTEKLERIWHNLFYKFVITKKIHILKLHNSKFYSLLYFIILILFIFIYILGNILGGILTKNKGPLPGGFQ